ncbi:class I SAM-dependent methyltransferase [Thermodesulfobacteriota bacterium]
MSSRITCMLCNIHSPAELVSATVRDDPSARFKIVRCITCGHVQLFPHPSPEENTEYYATDSQTRSVMGGVDFSIWKTKTAADEDRHINWLNSIMLHEGKVLDVCCGYGFLADRMAKAGYQATGVDISRERIDLANARLHGTFICSAIDDVFIAAHRNEFGTVTLFQALEHINDPVAFLRQLRELVSPGGLILIEVPNCDDELITYNDHYNRFYWQRAHLSYFDAARLALVLRKAGIKEFTIRGVQRYGLRNLIHWLDEGSPQLEDPSYYAKEPCLAHIEQMYRLERERAMTSDTLIAEIRICQ